MQTCPISTQRVDTHKIRIMAGSVFVLSSLYLFTQQPLFVLLLSTDFFLRLANVKHSPLQMMASFIQQRFDIAPSYQDDAPKRFALKLGVILLLSSIITLCIHIPLLTVLSIGILALCSFAEAVFDYCVGCKLYAIISFVKREI